MKKLFVLCTALAALFSSCGSQTAEQVEEAPALKLSTFSDHALMICRQDSCSLAEAAAYIQSVGIEAFDVRPTLTADQMAVFDSLGFQIASCILDVSHPKQPVPELEENALQFCAQYKIGKLMYCPVILPEGASTESKDSLVQTVKAFADKCTQAGIEIMFEDYDDPCALTYNMAALDKLFEAVPQATHALDTGNFFFASEEPMDALNHFKGRISHVHLKDRVAMGDKASPAIGTGVVPCRQIVDQMLADGYTGYFTIEGFNAQNMKELLKTSVENLTK